MPRTLQRPVMRDASSPPRAQLWLRRLRPGSARHSNQAPNTDPLRSAGQALRDAREAKGLKLRELAQRTRISIAVLEAFEGGWKDRLPEATYLRAMLPLLEKHLDLPPGSLEAVLPHAGGRGRGPGLQGMHGSPFSLSSIQLLASWQSTLAYGLLVLGLIYALNLQQKRLAAMGRLEAGSIALAPSSAPAAEEKRDPFPDLHPLNRAAQGQAMALLGQETLRGGPDFSLGLLRLQLNQPTELDLRGPRGGGTQLRGLEGEITLPVFPPFELRLTPAPSPAAVRWRGTILEGKRLAPGSSAVSYTVPTTRALGSSSTASPPPRSR